MVSVHIEVDPHDFLDGKAVFLAVMEDALGLLENGRPDKAASLISDAIGRKVPPAIADPEETRRLHMIKLFDEWYRINPAGRPDFWTWSHGKRRCS